MYCLSYPVFVSLYLDSSLCRVRLKYLQDNHSYSPLAHVWLCGAIGAEVAVLCITKSGEVINYQAFTNSKGIYSIAETMPESDRWESCLARPISSFHHHCTRRGDAHSGVKFTYNKLSGNSHNVKTFLYKPVNVALYCS
jgi:hypothetical protein